MKNVISTQLFENEIKAVWPDIEYQIPSDRAYLVPDAPALKSYAAWYAKNKPPGVDTLFECEEFSADFIITHRKWQARQAKKDPANWAMARCFTTKNNGEKIDHWMVIALTDQGVYMIEPQTGQMWPADRAKDHCHIIIM